MKFEKFYLLDYRGKDNKIILKFVHCKNFKCIKCPTYEIVKILQCGEIQMQTKFATKKFINIILNHHNRNLRNFKIGSPINIYYIPVELSENEEYYIMKFEN